MTTPTTTEPKVATCDHGISIALAFGTMTYPLTDCCKASGKGWSDDEYEGVVCRQCYAPVDAVYGDCGSIHTVDRMREWLAEIGCPKSAHCIVKVVAALS